MATADFLPDIRLFGFALNHNNWQERLQRRIYKLSGHESEYSTIAARNLARAIKQARPDLILITDLHYFPDPILEVLQQARRNAAIAHWIGDFFDERLARSSGVIDHFCFTDSSFLDDARRIGILNGRYLPLAANPTLFNTEKAQQRRSDLVFIGAYSSNRQRLIEAITSPKIVIGKGWPGPTRPGDRILSHNISLAAVAARYKQSEIVLNVLNHNNVRHGLNMRCFEATACGALLLTETTPDNARCFQVGREILIYNAPSDIDAQIQALRSEPEKIQEVARLGQQRTISEHFYHHRLRTLIETS